MIAEVAIHVMGVILTLMMLPFSVYVISWTLTLGHWENHQYRRPAATLSAIVFALAASMLILRVFFL